MMQVIGAGMPRTGTLSCHAALEQLLGGECYHMKTVPTKKDALEQWHRWASDESSLDLARVSRGFTATVDAPLCFYYQELMELYPEAKVLLTVRDAEGWYASFSGLMKTVSRLKPVGRLNPRLRKFFGFVTILLERHGLEGSRDALIAEYERHNAEVQEAVPADRLLVFEAREGWEPLCDFLGVEAPDEPFPHLNSGSGALRGAVARMMIGRAPSNLGRR